MPSRYHKEFSVSDPKGRDFNHKNNKVAKAKTGVLLINLGTPDNPSVKAVRKYLREFLMDERIIDLPFYKRWLLVNLIIVPFRASKSARSYAKLWDTHGSPLLAHSLAINEKLQKALGKDWFVVLSMRYGKPGISNALDKIISQKVKRIIVLPLFPQYAPATTGSALKAVINCINERKDAPAISYIKYFFDHQLYIKALVAQGKDYLEHEKYDHVLFSFHGLPERQILKNAPGPECNLSSTCCTTFHNGNELCYRAQCYATARLLAKSLSLTSDDYTISFQSRLGKGSWLKPYTSEKAGELPDKGKKRVLVFSPSFTVDCLETTIELGQEYKDIFIAAGGKRWDVVRSLNDGKLFIEALRQIILAG